MGMIARRKTKWVKQFVVVLSSHDERHEAAPAELESLFGAIEHVTKPHQWNFSPKYTDELGPGIRRSFVVLKSLKSADALAEWKHATNALEARWARHSARRVVNLDPGYVDGSNVILASTKHYANRVYLRDGIYADLTLFYDGERYQPFPQTLPDYKTRSAVRFLMRLRMRYLDDLARKRAEVDFAESKLLEQQILIEQAGINRGRSSADRSSTRV